MMQRNGLKDIWSHKWRILAFCVFIFLLVDHAVIHSTECYASPCFRNTTLVVRGMTFLAPTGIYSAHLLMPLNYQDRYAEGIYFRGGLVYQAATHAVIEDDLDPTEVPFITSEHEKSFLASSFLVHKFRVLLSFPLWIGLYWLLFIRLRKSIKRNAYFYPVPVVLMLAFMLFGLLLKIEIDGGKDVTWQYVFGAPEKASVDYASGERLWPE